MREESALIVILFAPRRFRRERELLHDLANALGERGIKLIPFPPPPPLGRHIDEWIDDWDERWERWWEHYRWRRDLSSRDWDYWWDAWDSWHYWEYFYSRGKWTHRRFREPLRRAIERGGVRGVLVVTVHDMEGEVDDPAFAGFTEFVRGIEFSPLIHVRFGIGRGESPIIRGLGDVQSFDYPDDRVRLLEVLGSLGDVRLVRHAALVEPHLRVMASAPPSDDIPSTRAIAPDEVHLGAAAPPVVVPGEEFIARFAAYTVRYKDHVGRIIEQEAPTSRLRLGLDACRWHPGARITVRLAASQTNIANPVQTFTWNGAWCVLRFDVTLQTAIDSKILILKFDVAVEGLPVAALRPEIAVGQGSASVRASHYTFAAVPAPTSAFASYARADRREVLGRVRSLQIFTGIDVFLDCLSIRPGEEWKVSLRKEIRTREIFWLFWSRNAKQSEWVDWEWRTALAEKSLSGIQPHPLEAAELAPPPEELSALQFGGMYEWYLSHMRRSDFVSAIRAILYQVIFGARNLLFHKGTRRVSVRRISLFAIAIVLLLMISGIMGWVYTTRSRSQPLLPHNKQNDGEQNHADQDSGADQFGRH